MSTKVDARQLTWLYSGILMPADVHRSQGAVIPIHQKSGQEQEQCVQKVHRQCDFQTVHAPTFQLLHRRTQLLLAREASNQRLGRACVISEYEKRQAHHQLQKLVAVFCAAEIERGSRPNALLPFVLVSVQR